jgi:hypothetical protein
MNSDNSKNNNAGYGEIISWIMIAICMAIAWPIGLYLLYRKIQGGTGAEAAKPENITSGGDIKKSDRKRKAGSGFLLSAFLLLAGGVLLAIGLSFLFAFLYYTIENGGLASKQFDVFSIFNIIFFTVGGAATLSYRSAWKKRMQRVRGYLSFIGDRDVVPMAAFMEAFRVRPRTLERDLLMIIQKGYLDEKAYVDRGLRALVMSPKAAEEARNKKYAEEQIKNPENNFFAVVREIRDINNSVTDAAVSAKISQLEELTAKIFRAVEDSPEKLPKISRFQEYYLPTTMKLLRSYRELQCQNIGGEIMSSTKKDIEKVLDTLIIGYKAQLDRLYADDYLDISSDISVLETLMTSDGLTGFDKIK